MWKLRPSDGWGGEERCCSRTQVRQVLGRDVRERSTTESVEVLELHGLQPTADCCCRTAETEAAADVSLPAAPGRPSGLELTQPLPLLPQIAKKGPHTESATVGRSASYKRAGKW